MNRVTTRRIVLVLAATIFAVVSAAAEEPKAGIAWLDDWGKALSQAKEQQRPILLEFYTAWCVYCGKLEKETFGDARVVDLAKDFVCVRLDADVAKGVAARYSPEGFPTTILAASNGDELVHINGFRDADTFSKVLTVMREQAPRMSEWIARIDENSKDIEARESLGRAYLDLGMADKAGEQLEAALKAGPSSETDDAGESDDARIRFHLARAYMAADDYRRAAKTLEALIAANSGSPNAPAYWLELARAHLSAGKRSKAKAAVDELQSSYSGSPEAATARTLLESEKSKVGS